MLQRAISWLTGPALNTPSRKMEMLTVGDMTIKVGRNSRHNWEATACLDGTEITMEGGWEEKDKYPTIEAARRAAYEARPMRPWRPLSMRLPMNR